ncbi:MAG: MarR family transcriptional regulator [Pseudomonadota bacterium]
MSLNTDDLLRRVANLEALNSHLTFRISRMAKMLEVEGAKRLSGSGINLTAYRMMLVIEVFEEISVSDLSRIMLIDRAQISRAASQLIERDLIEARSDKTSRRKKLIALTPEGAAVYARLRARFDEREASLTAALEPDQRALWSAIDGLSSWLEQEIEDAAR